MVMLTTQDRVARKYSLDGKIHILNDGRFPLLAILTGAQGKDPVSGKRAPLKKQVTTDPEFKWYEDGFASRSATVAATQTIDLATGGNINVTTGEGAKFLVNDVVHFPQIGANFRVIAISGDTLTLSAELGGGTGTQDVSNQEVYIVGSAFEEGSGSAGQRYTQAQEKSGYCQIFKTTYEVTNTSQATQTLVTQDPLSYQRSKQLKEHAVDIERAFLFGKKSIDLTSGKPRRYTEGVLNAVQSVAQANVTTEADFNSFITKVFENGNYTKYMFASPAVMNMIASFGASKTRLTQEETKYGVRYSKYITPQGELILVQHKLLVGPKYGNYAFVLDMPNVKYRFLKGRDTHLKKNVQNPDDDSIKEQILTEAGLQIMHESTHAKMSMAAL